MMNRLTAILIMTIASTAVLTGCASAVQNSDVGRAVELLSPDEDYQKEDNYSIEVTDLSTIYEDQHLVKVVYMTVGQGSSDDGTNHTWDELNRYDLEWYAEEGIDPYSCESLIQFGNETGPTAGSYGFNVTSANSTVRLSGQGASTRQQKSYRVKLKNGCGNIDGMKTVVLSKSFTDPFRMTNKLFYELMQEVPSLLSTRTCFVHLYVKDVTENSDTKFQDYGLYTMVEPITKKYLGERNLDSSGELYKAVNFDFGRHSDVIMQPTDASFRKKEFEKFLESKGSEDYSKLIAMLDAIDDPSISIEDIVHHYFDEDNLYDWMAFNILVDNKDTAIENFFLYSPTGSDRFYLISWDNDKAFRGDYEKLRDSSYSAGWDRGIFLYSDSILFRRILLSESCTNKLSEHVAKLHESVLSGEHVTAKAKELASISKSYVYDLPDLSFARVTSAHYDELIEDLAAQMDVNYYAYYDTLEMPWPFHIASLDNVDNKIIYSWEPATAMNDAKVTYHIEVDDTWQFVNPIYEADLENETSYESTKLTPGQYFVRVTATTSDEVGDVSDEQNAQSSSDSQAERISQIAIENYNTEKKTTVHGVLCFYVKKDGTVSASLFEE